MYIFSHLANESSACIDERNRKWWKKWRRAKENRNGNCKREFMPGIPFSSRFIQAIFVRSFASFRFAFRQFQNCNRQMSKRVNSIRRNKQSVRQTRAQETARSEQKRKKNTISFANENDIIMYDLDEAIYSLAKQQPIDFIMHAYTFVCSWTRCAREMVVVIALSQSSDDATAATAANNNSGSHTTACAPDKMTKNECKKWNGLVSLPLAVII